MSSWWFCLSPFALVMSVPGMVVGLIFHSLDGFTMAMFCYGALGMWLLSSGAFDHEDEQWRRARAERIAKEEAEMERLRPPDPERDAWMKEQIERARAFGRGEL